MAVAASRARCSNRLLSTVFTEVSLDTLDPLHTRFCASGCVSPMVAIQSWTDMLSPSRSLGVWSRTVPFARPTVPNKQPSQAIVEARKDEVCARGNYY